MKTLALTNVRCFRSVEIPLDAPVTVLIGENGAGKTTVAEALASLVHGDDEGLATFPLRRGARRGSIRLEGGAGELAAWESDGARRRLPQDTLVFAYGRYRRVMPPPPSAPAGGPVLLGPDWQQTAYLLPWQRDPEQAARTRRTVTLTRSDAFLLTDFAATLLDVEVKRVYDPRFERVWQRLDRFVRDLGEGFDGIRVDERDDVSVAVVVRGGEPLALGELSDGYQSVLAIVIDLLLRFAHLFPEAADPFASEALVVIDEVDLHLHPRWQRVVVGQLKRLLPKVRFLLTTHSLAVVQGAIDDGERVLVLSGEGGQVRVRALAKREMAALRGAELGSVAVEDHLFDLPSRYSPAIEELEAAVRGLRAEVEAGAGITRRRLLAAKLEQLHTLFAKDEERRAQGGFLKEVGDTQMALVKRLAAELEG